MKSMKIFKRGIIIGNQKLKKMRFFLTSLAGLVLLWLNDVDFSVKTKFYGLPHIKTATSSKVIIGAKCVFRSSSTSNLIGINRKCILFADKHSILEIGEGSGFSGTVLGCFKSIKLGKNVRCGANTLITDGDWHQEDKRVGPPKAVEIGDDVWLGVNVSVLKGVKIGKNTIIGAGSIVVSDIPSNCIAAGNPCKVIRTF